jgi:hypothetical protein
VRAWIEGGNNDMKHSGWYEEQTKMTDLARAEWQWLVLALAT